MKDLLHLNFVPRSPDAALLVLRLWVGGSMLALHGWEKLLRLFSGQIQFGDPLGIGVLPSLLLATLAEVVGSVLLICGLLTRLAAFSLIVTMAVAFFLAKGGRLTGPDNGELAFLYLGAAVVLFVAGAGRFSLDRK